MFGWLLALLALHGATRLLRRRSPWPRVFLGGVARIAGARVSVRGVPARAPVLILANHQSWLDIMLLAGASGCAFVSKSEISRAPVGGWLASLNNTIFIVRSDRSGVRAQADALAAGLATHQPIALFPEGTTGDGARLLPFNASLLAAVAGTGGAVQPVAIDYRAARDDIAWPGDEPALVNVRRVLGRRGRFDVTLTFVPPFPAPADRKALARAAHAAIDAALYGPALYGNAPDANDARASDRARPSL